VLEADCVTSSVKTRDGSTSLRSSRMKVATFLEGFASIKLLAISISHLVDHSKPTLAHTMNLFLISETTAQSTTSPILSITLPSKVRHLAIVLSWCKSHFSQGDDEYDYWKAEAGRAMKKRLDITAGPLDGTSQHVTTLTFCSEHETYTRSYRPRNLNSCSNTSSRSSPHSSVHMTATS
jgi:hypothetical protein